MHANSALELFLAVVPAVALILVVARVVGWLSTKIGQPRVVGEMIAGVLLGPTLLGWVAPGFSAHLFTADVKTMLYSFSNLGLTLYMFLVGADMEHTQLTGQQVRRAGILAVAGILPGFLLGAGVGYFMYETLSVHTITKSNFIIFMGCAMCVTAFPMLARILQENNLSNTRIGSLTLVAASIDDAVAWSFLALVTALAQAKSPISGLYTAGGGAVFAIIMLTVVKKLMRRVGEKVEKTGMMTADQFALVLMIVLGAGWVTDSIGIFSVFGGFITGLSMPKHAKFREELRTKLYDFTVIFLLPIFFVYSGLNTKLSGFFSAETLVPLCVVTLTAIASKFAGCTLSMKAMGFTWGESSAIGGLMNARGLMELALLNIGMAYGIISQQLFSMLVFMAVLTTAMAMPIYNLSLPREHELSVRKNKGALPQGARVSS